MNTLFLHVQTPASAAFEIILMLLGAGIIGFFTAYFYFRNKYRREQQTALSALNDKVTQLEERNQQLKAEQEALDKKYKAAQALHQEAANEATALSSSNDQLSHELKEKDLVLNRITERKKLLNYESFGRATETEKDDLTQVSGIGPFIQSKLHALDIYTLNQISQFSEEDIRTVNDAIEFFPGRIERDEWVAQAQELIHTKGKDSDLLKKLRQRKHLINYSRIGIAHPDEADDLTVISGIGKWIQEKLNALDIYTYRQIAAFTKEDEEAITKAIEFFPGRIHRDEWVPQAKELLHSNGQMTDLLQRMKQRKHKIDYASIGIAHVTDAQDLTKINGIGAFIQEKLNAIDIYTYEQISRFTPTDIRTVTEVIEFFPGRIERDNWVEQAKGLADQYPRTDTEMVKA
jgi:predicted flap endonuclease-1-like 5' DNA nuclease